MSQTNNANQTVRAHGRAQDQLRHVRMTRGYTVHAEGSVLIEFGDTRVLCTASVEEKVPGHKKAAARAGSPRNTACCPRHTHPR